MLRFEISRHNVGLTRDYFGYNTAGKELNKASQGKIQQVRLATHLQC